MKNLFMMMALMMCFTVSFGQTSANYSQVINKEVKGKLDSYTTQAGEIFKVGDEIELGVAKGYNYQFIVQEFALQLYPLPTTASHSKVKIKKISAASRMVTVWTTPAGGGIYGLGISNFESAIKDGEIKTNLMSSDQALEELKKWKDKLDLGLISQDDFEKKKTELSKLIK